MKCKNCGAELRANSDICPNCGTVADDCYVLVSSEYEANDYRKDDDSPKKKTARYVINAIISFVLVFALVGGSYYYFNDKFNKQEAPALSFETGTGIVNDRQIVYLTIKDSSNIEFIQSVKMYEGDVTDTSTSSLKPLSTKYEYTKNSGESFRSIFFYADNLNIEKSKTYTLTFDMTFSFVDDARFYTYKQATTFSGDIKQDVSSIIFDHSLKEDQKQPEANPKKETTTKPASETTTELSGDMTFITKLGYWYNEPKVEGDKKSIEVWEFKENKDLTITTYTQNGSEKWETKTEDYRYGIEGIVLRIRDKNKNEFGFVRADPFNKTVVLVDKNKSDELAEFTLKSDNSIETAKEFFE